MEELNHTYSKTKTLHHAYCMEGFKEDVYPELKEFFERELQIATRGNPDYWYSEYDTFGIDNARELKVLQSRMSVSGGRKIFVLILNFITHEAQNSLLKVLEEPTRDTHFFIIAPKVDIFLPTLASRMYHISSKHSKYSTEEKLIQGFLSAEIEKRIVLLEEITTEKNKARALRFLEGLETNLRKNIKPMAMTRDDIFVFEEIGKCRGYLKSRSPSVKIILEHIALITPVQSVFVNNIKRDTV